MNDFLISRRSVEDKRFWNEVARVTIQEEDYAMALSTGLKMDFTSFSEKYRYCRSTNAEYMVQRLPTDSLRSDVFYFRKDTSLIVEELRNATRMLYLINKEVSDYFENE